MPPNQIPGIEVFWHCLAGLFSAYVTWLKCLSWLKCFCLTKIFWLNTGEIKYPVILRRPEADPEGMLWQVCHLPFRVAHRCSKWDFKSLKQVRNFPLPLLATPPFPSVFSDMSPPLPLPPFPSAPSPHLLFPLSLPKTEANSLHFCSMQC